MKILVTVLALASFSLAAHAEKVTVAIKKMHCADCAETIQDKFKANPKVKNVSVSYKTKLMVLETEGKLDLTDEAIKTEIASAGFKTGKITRAN